MSASSEQDGIAQPTSADRLDPWWEVRPVAPRGAAKLRATRARRELGSGCLGDDALHVSWHPRRG